MLTVVHATALLVREQRGIGFEGIALPAIYAGTVVLALSVV